MVYERQEIQTKQYRSDVEKKRLQNKAKKIRAYKKNDTKGTRNTK